jgi:glycosyltransferase involved in cell wall biosynthesis
MKVLIVDTGSKFNAFGGQQKIAARLYYGLKPSVDTYYLGYETHYMGEIFDPNVISLSGSGGLAAGRIRKGRLSENALVRILYNMMLGKMLVGTDVIDVYKKVKEVAPDVIISNAVSDFALLSRLKKMGLKFKAVYIDHGSISTTAVTFFGKEAVPLTVGSGLGTTTVASAKERFFGFFDMNVALNAAQKREMLKFTERVVYVPNGVHMETKVSAAQKRSERENDSLPQKNFVVLYLGRLFERQKNISTLIRAFMGTKRRDATLLIIGNGPSATDYIKLASKDDRIIFGGPVEEGDTKMIYAISDLFVLPSLWEGASLTILEAAQFSLHIILSKNIYSRELAADNEDKLLSFEPYDQKGLTELIELMINDKSARRKAQKVSKRIAAKFTEENMLREYKRVLRRILD